MSHPFAEPGVDSSGGMMGKGAELQSDVAEGLCIRTKGVKTETETGDSDFFFFWDAKESLCDVLLLAASAST